eukprot:Cvel_19329.t1-p1 / transcript=Cvel_19329.t1 / gene=Cvel_19329 / organism=Chromera_velia_CCMP2878 / gene_product=hypothetical protein / transcript_product=hypothetical protein / location=Cvel_scaffold1659:452-1250(-) / protein_length=141 / sequence_SO=supercontig / SO=protein_coding / is_pseudo=false
MFGLAAIWPVFLCCLAFVHGFVKDEEAFIHRLGPLPLSFRRSSRRLSRAPTVLNIKWEESGSAQAAEVLPLTYENVETVLQEARETLYHMFGYADTSKKVNISGEIDLEDLDGGTVIVRLSGRFWHKRSDVILRVESFMRE